MTGLDLRLAVTEAIITCERCVLHERVDTPVPFSGQPSDIVVIGDAPRAAEHEKGKPFVGPPGELLRKHLDTAGFDSDNLAYMNVISCSPGQSKMSDEFVSACSPNRLGQLDYLDPKWVLLLGGTALQVVRPDLEIGHARGAPFTHPDFECVFFPTYHPSYVRKQQQAEKAFAADLATFKALTESDDPIPFASDTCGRCGLDAIYWEPTMIGWGNCSSPKCGLPDEMRPRIAAVLGESDGLACRGSGCSTPASKHVLSFPTGEAPEQMTWDALSNDQRRLMYMVFTGGNKGVPVADLVAQSRSNEVALVGELDRLATLGWVLKPEVHRNTWVMSPRGRRMMP